jgi:hypothetical protein
MNVMQLQRSHVVARAEERGYDVASIEPCFVKDLGGGMWEVDVDHAAYPRAKTPDPDAAAHVGPPPAGPGTELKKLLKLLFGASATPNCPCNAHAAQMDSWGPDECQRRMPEILGWLEEQAKARGLPFVRFGAEQVVKLAIRRARKSAPK